MTQTTTYSDDHAAMLRGMEAERLNGPVCPCCIEDVGDAYLTRKGDNGYFVCPHCESEYTAGEIAKRLSDLLIRCYGNLADYRENVALADENAALKQALTAIGDLAEMADRRAA